MKPEEKDLLLKELSARLPYKLMCNITDYTAEHEEDENFDACLLSVERTDSGGYTTFRGAAPEYPVWNNLQQLIKPYLRPMSSMTEEEKQSLLRAWNIKASFVGSRCDAIVSDNTWWGGKDKSEPLGFDSVPFKYMSAVIDWLSQHHFDYQGLIERGLALEAPKGMYN